MRSHQVHDPQNPLESQSQSRWNFSIPYCYYSVHQKGMWFNPCQLFQFCTYLSLKTTLLCFVLIWCSTIPCYLLSSIHINLHQNIYLQLVLGFPMSLLVFLLGAVNYIWLVSAQKHGNNFQSLKLEPQKILSTVTSDRMQCRKKMSNCQYSLWHDVTRKNYTTM